MGKAQILVFEAFKVAQHLGLGAITLEHLVREVVTLAMQRGRYRVRCRVEGGIEGTEVDLPAGQNGDQLGDLLGGRDFVEAHADVIVEIGAQVVAGALGGLKQFQLAIATDVEQQGVEVMLVNWRHAGLGQCACCGPCHTMNPIGDGANALGAMPDGIEA